MQGQFHGRTEIAPDQKQKFLQRLQQVHQNQQGHGTGAALLGAGGSSQIPHLAAPMPKQSLGSQQQPAFLQQVSNIFAAFPLCAYKQTAHQGYLRYTNMNALVVLRICLKLDRLGSQIVQASLPWFVKGYMSHVILLILILFSFRIGKTVSQSSSCGAKAC